jgi:hypothetical protein
MLTEADRRHTHGRSDLYVDLCGKEFADGQVAFGRTLAAQKPDAADDG